MFIFGFNVHDRGLWKTGISLETSSPSITIAVVRWLFPLQIGRGSLS